MQRKDVAASSAQSSIPEHPTWKKQGNFAWYSVNYSFERRYLEYTNPNLSNVSNILFHGYEDGGVALKLELDDQIYEIFIEKSKFCQYPHVRNAFKHPIGIGMRRLGFDYDIDIPNIEFLKNYLVFLEQFEPSIKEIANEILESVKPYIAFRKTIFGWDVTGNYHSFMYPDSPSIDRKILYKSITCPSLDSISITATIKGDIAVRIIMKHEPTFQLYVQSISEYLESTSYSTHGIAIIIKLINDNHQKSMLNRILYLLADLYSDVDFIIPDIISNYDKAHYPIFSSIPKSNVSTIASSLSKNYNNSLSYNLTLNFHPITL